MFGRKYESVYNSSPTSADNTNNVIEIVDERIRVANHTECLLEISDVVEAVRILRKGKFDGSLRFFSDHNIIISLLSYSWYTRLYKTVQCRKKIKH